jgi:hypothetical protein
VNDRSYHQSQGKIEHGHQCFKEVLQKWMDVYGENWLINEHVIQFQMNQHMQYDEQNYSHTTFTT